MDAGLGRGLREGASPRLEHHSPCPVFPVETLSQDSYSYGLSTATSGYENKQYPPSVAGQPQLPATATLCPPGGSGWGPVSLLIQERPWESPISNSRFIVQE